MLFTTYYVPPVTMGLMFSIDESYPPRNAFTMFSLAALADGRKPPRKPITIAKITDACTMDGFRANEKVNSENELKFIVEIDRN